MRPGGHDRRTVGIGPDHKLYVSIGSTCNFCADPPDENAVIWRTSLDGTGREVFARGLRNTIGFGWHPQTKEMFGMDHGVDWLGDDYPREELNKLVQGGDYGWPYCTNDRKPDTRIKPPGGQTGQQYCAKTIPPVLGYTAHSAPLAMQFYNADMFPADYKGDAFVAFHGSWNREPAAGYEVMRVKFEKGKPVRFEPFMSGFLLPGGKTQFGRPSGLAVLKDGSLLVSDDDGGVIYRVTYKK
jgi:glucose/arabinose dehydrogenase